MALTIYQQCLDDPENAHALQQWESTLSDVENSFAADYALLDTQITNMHGNRQEATITLTISGFSAIRLTWLNATYPGYLAHQFSFYSASYGATMPLLSYYVPAYKQFQVSLETDGSGTITTTTDDLTALLAAYSSYFTVENLMPGFVVEASGGTIYFSGAVNASVTTTKAAMNKIYGTQGQTYLTVLTQLGLPTGVGKTEVETLASASNLVVLTSGKVFTQTGTNLTVLRQFWTLLGASSTATQTIRGLLPGTLGQPIVVWKEVTTTTSTATTCDGGATTLTTSETSVGNPNTKPSSTTAIPTVWWRERIDSGTPNLKLLNGAGLSSSQVTNALNSSYETTYIIEDVDVFETFSLTEADFTELMSLDVEGIGLLTSYEAFLDQLKTQKATAANGYTSPSWNLPTSTLGPNITPSQSLAGQFAEFEASPCIDPLAKLKLRTFLAMIEAGVKTVERLITKLIALVRPIFNELSSILANIKMVLDNTKGSTCIIGVDLGSLSVDVDALNLEVELLTYDIKSLFDRINGVITATLQPNICKIEQAIRNLLGPEADTLEGECLVQGLTDAIINAFGAALTQLSLQLPCIVSPFSYIGLLMSLQLKVQGLMSLLAGLVGEVRNLLSQWNLISGILARSPDTMSPRSCSDPSINNVIGGIRSKLGV